MSYQPPPYPQQPQQPPGQPYGQQPPFVPGQQSVPPAQPPIAPPPGYGYPPHLPPPKKSRTWIGVVGLIVVVLVVGCAGLSAFVKDGSKAVSKSLADTQKGKRAVAGQVGKPATDGKFQFTVTSMHCGVSEVGDSFLNKKAQGEYCLVNVMVKNVGDSSETFNSGSQAGIGADGTQLSTDVTAEGYVNDQDQTFLEEINPGNQVKGTLVFDVPKGTRLAAIVLHEDTYSAGVKVPLKDG